MRCRARHPNLVTELNQGEGKGKLSEYPKPSKKKLTYHGRSGYPILHKTKTSNKTYIMVRVREVEGGGTKRLYLDKSGNVPKKHRKPIKHRGKK